MKTIIAGSRHVTSLVHVEMAVYFAQARKGITISEVISGCARGVDQLAITWAEAHELPVKRFPADWNKWGPGAGPVRNEDMARYCEALIAIWDGISQGTRDMIERAKLRGVPVYIYRVMKPKTKRKLLERGA